MGILLSNEDTADESITAGRTKCVMRNSYDCQKQQLTAADALSALRILISSRHEIQSQSFKSNTMPGLTAIER